MCNWISVKDKLPTVGENVLASVDGKLQIMTYGSWPENGKTQYAWCMVYDGLDGDGYFDEDYNVTHWMPLPEVPKGGDL
jgi:hypothetical protein